MSRQPVCGHRRVTVASKTGLTHDDRVILRSLLRTLRGRRVELAREVARQHRQGGQPALTSLFAIGQWSAAIDGLIDVLLESTFSAMPSRSSSRAIARPGAVLDCLGGERSRRFQPAISCSGRKKAVG
jgi:hypothetical protein